MKKIVIVGGGPAGLIAGLYLSKLDMDISIYEKCRFNEYKHTPCGEAISALKVGKLENDTGFDSSPYISKKIDGLESIYPNKKSSFIYQRGYTLYRDEWQKGIISYLKKRNINFHFNQSIGDSNDVSFDYLIAADGPSSKIRKKLGFKVDFYTTSQYKTRMDSINLSYLQFYFDDMFYNNPNEFGYGWVFPKNNIFNIGCLGNFKTLDVFVKKYGLDINIVSKDAYPIAYNGSVFKHDNIFLIGDAAGLTNPVSGGGLSPIIACSQFLYNDIKAGIDYQQQIEKSLYNPRFWTNIRKHLFLKNKYLKKIGIILDGENQNDLSFSAKIRIIKNIHLLSKLMKMKGVTKKSEKASW